MIFKCNYCKYSTNNKSNYTRHVKSSSHIIMSKNVQNGHPKRTANCKCECGKTYYDKSGLLKHKGKCKFDTSILNNINVEITELKNILTQTAEINKQLLIKNEQLITRNEQLDKLLLDYVKNNNSVNGNNNNNITYNISIKNYLQQNYSDAPYLTGINDPSKITYDEEYDEFIDVLVYNYNNSNLNKYIGDFIIANYKKNNPSEQSMWSSDISRLTYIIKELLANKKSIWNHDYKGTKIKTYIIDPLLQYIKKYIDDYWIKNIDSFKTKNLDQINKMNNTYNVIYKIKKIIDNDILSTDIVKYIAPHFYMNRDKNEDTDIISLFIDE